MIIKSTIFGYLKNVNYVRDLDVDYIHQISKYIYFGVFIPLEIEKDTSF